MTEGFLRVALLLAYGPLLLTLALYAAALALRCCGKPDLLTLLVERTKEQPPVPRHSAGGHY